MELVLFIVLPAVLAAVYLAWNFRFNHDAARQSEAPIRRREDARDWQRRFGADSLLAAHFLQPTQNEILETLYVLDHLAPGWETGEPDKVERHFLDELALSFPLLRKPGCEFPVPFAERLTAKGAGAKSARTKAASEEEVAAKREEFQAFRAHANAREQITSGPTRPAVVTPGSLPFRVSSPGALERRGNPWPARLAGAMVLGAAVYGIIQFLPHGVGLKSGGHAAETPLVQVAPKPTLMASEPVSPAPATTLPPVANDPSTTIAEPVAATEPEAPPAESPAPAAVAATTPAVASSTTPPPTPDPAKAALAQRIAASKQRALSKYPELAVEGSEINLRFVFRYKALIQQNSPRLLDPNWPEQLVEECAAAAGSSLKHTALTQITADRR